jgi:hypothetical protein
MFAIVFESGVGAEVKDRVIQRLDGVQPVFVPLSSIDEVVAGSTQLVVLLWDSAAVEFAAAARRALADHRGPILVVRSDGSVAPQFGSPGHPAPVVDLDSTNQVFNAALNVAVRKVRRASREPSVSQSSTRGALAFAPGAGLGLMIFAGMFVGATALSRDEIMTAVDANVGSAPDAQTIRTALYPPVLEALADRDNALAALRTSPPSASFGTEWRVAIEAPQEVLASAPVAAAPPIQLAAVDPIEAFQAPARAETKDVSVRVEPVAVTVLYTPGETAPVAIESGLDTVETVGVDVFENALFN